LKRHKKHSPRHSPSFVLLFISRGPNYGGAILKMMEEEIPCFLGDSAMVYRMLQELEEEGAVVAQWEVPESGRRPIKNYHLTEKGWEMLLEDEEEMQKRMNNHQFFLSELQEAKKRKELK